MKTSVGIDYSMTCPAACVLNARVGSSVAFCFVNDRKYGTLPSNVTHVPSIPASTNVHATVARFSGIAKEVVSWIAGRIDTSDTIGLEDYAFAAKGRVFHIGENTAHLKRELWNIGLVWAEIPPTVIKKFATGKGNADKTMMTGAFLEAYPDAKDWIPLFFPKAKPDTDTAKSPLADIADAYWIARYRLTN